MSFLHNPYIGENDFFRMANDTSLGLNKEMLWNGERYVPAYIHVSGLELGPALGGCRIHVYGQLSEAEENAEKLSRGMRYKSALANVPFGGGKAVIATDPKMGKRAKETLLTNFAAFVRSLNGDYITAEDSGTNIRDMEFLFKLMPYVVGTKMSGNPSPVTAYGVYQGLMACLAQQGTNSVEGLTIALKGAGSVAESIVFGFPEKDKRFDAEIRAEFPGLIRMNPAMIHYTDTDTRRASYFKKKAKDLGLGHKLKAHFAEDGEIYDIPGTNVFIPAAARYSASGDFIDRLAASGCKIITGCENNQLRDREADMARIQAAGMTYAPDFAINAGGLINVAEEYAARKERREFNPRTALLRTREIRETIDNILMVAKQTGKTTLQVAEELAEQRIEQARAA